MFLIGYPIFLLFTFGMGLRLLTVFRYQPESKLVHFFIAIVLGYAFTGQMIAVIGLLSLLYNWLVWLVFIFGVLINFGIIVLFLREIRWQKAFEMMRESAFPERAFFFMSLIVLLLYKFFSLAPQIHWDAMSYHYLVPKYFLEHHALIDLPDIIFSYYPSLIEMQYLAGMALGGETTANLIGNSHGIILYIGIFALAILHFKNWRIGVWGGMVLLCTRGIHNHFEGGWNDIGTSLFILASIMILFEYGKYRHRGLIWLAAILAGGALASKHYAWIPLIFMLFFLFFDNLITRKGLRRAVSEALIFLIVAILVPLLWYLRSYVYTANPVYPFSMFGLFPTYELEPFVVTSWATAGFPRNIYTFLAYPYHLLLSRTWVSDLSGQFSYLMVLAPISLVEMRKPEVRAYWLFLAYVLFVMYFIAPFETRYMLYILPFVAVMVGYAVMVTLSKVRAGGRFVLPMLFVIFLIPFSMNMKLFDHYFNDRLDVIIKREWKDQYLIRQSHNYAMIHWMNHNLPLDAKVLCLENRLYRMERDFITWYGMRVKYPENAVEAMQKNYDAGNTHMYLGELGMAQAYILWHIYNLPFDEQGFVEFRTDDIMKNLFDEPIPDKFWILHLSVARDMERWGFERVIKNDETYYRVRKDILDTAVANHAAILLVALFKDMVQKEWITKAGEGAYDGLNIVFEFQYDKFNQDTKSDLNHLNN